MNIRSILEGIGNMYQYPVVIKCLTGYDFGVRKVKKKSILNLILIAWFEIYKILVPRNISGSY